MGKSTSKKVATAAVLGLAIGYAAGLLTAPKSGKETRDDISDASQKAYNQMQKKLRSLNSELSDAIEQAKSQMGSLKKRSRDDLAGLIDSAQKAQAKVTKLIRSMHRGTASGEDVEEAIASAKEARDELEKFIGDEK
jgi:gas vesicle protein